MSLPQGRCSCTSAPGKGHAWPGNSFCTECSATWPVEDDFLVRCLEIQQDCVPSDRPRWLSDESVAINASQRHAKGAFPNGSNPDVHDLGHHELDVVASHRRRQ